MSRGLHNRAASPGQCSTRYIKELKWVRIYTLLNLALVCMCIMFVTTFCFRSTFACIDTGLNFCYITAWNIKRVEQQNRSEQKENKENKQTHIHTHLHYLASEHKVLWCSVLSWLMKGKLQQALATPPSPTTNTSARNHRMMATHSSLHHRRQSRTCWTPQREPLQ